MKWHSQSQNILLLFSLHHILFTCIQSLVERCHLNSVEGCGSRRARESLHNYPSCKGATEDLCMVGRVCV